MGAPTTTHCHSLQITASMWYYSQESAQTMSLLPGSGAGNPGNRLIVWACLPLSRFPTYQTSLPVSFTSLDCFWLKCQPLCSQPIVLPYSLWCRVSCVSAGVWGERASDDLCCPREEADAASEPVEADLSWLLHPSACSHFWSCHLWITSFSQVFCLCPYGPLLRITASSHWVLTRHQIHIMSFMYIISFNP